MLERQQDTGPARDAIVAVHLPKRGNSSKQQALAQRRSKFFRPKRRQQMEQLLGTKNPAARSLTSRAPPPLLQGITRKRWNFRSRPRAPAPEPVASPSSTSASSSLSTSPSSFLPTSATEAKRLEPIQGSSQMPLLVYRHAPRPKSDSELAVPGSTSQVPLLVNNSSTPSSLPHRSPRRVFQLPAVPRSLRPPSLRNAPPTPPLSSAALSPRSITTAANLDVLTVSEAHELLPRLTLVRARHMRTHHTHRRSSSGDSANAAPRKAMSRVDAFNSSRLSPASSAVGAPTAPFFELEDYTPDSQGGALRNWLAQPDELSMDLRRGGATGPLGSTSGLTGALTGALHGVLHLAHTPPSCCSTQRASSLAVSPLRSIPPRRAAPTLSSLNSSIMSSAPAGDDSALQATMTQSITPRECPRASRLDAHLDTITQEATVESTVTAVSVDAPTREQVHTSEDLDALSESTMALDTAMLPSVLPSCSAAGVPQRLRQDSVATSLRAHASLVSGGGVELHGAKREAGPDEAPAVVTPTSGALSDISGDSTGTPLSTAEPASPRATDALAGTPLCSASMLHQPSQMMSGQQDSCFDTVGSRPGGIVWDTADVEAPQGLECASEKQVSDSTVVSYIDGTSSGDTPRLISCTDDTSTASEQGSSKGKRAKWVSYLLCSCKAN